MLGAVICSHMAMGLLDVQSPPYFYFAFALGVWVVYSIDHLIDAIKNKNKSASLRYHLHYQYRKIIIFFAGLSILLVFYLVLQFFEKNDIIISLAFGGVVALYFFSLIFVKEKSILFQKELLVAFFYTMGIWAYPLIFRPEEIPVWYLLFMGSFFLITLYVLLTYSIIDEKTDVADKQNTFVILFGRKITMQVMKAAFFVNLLNLLIISIIFHSEEIVILEIVFVSMSMASITLKRFYIQLERIVWYKVLGEVIFFIPIIYFLFKN